MLLENLKFRDFKFINDPLPCSARDYLDAEREFVNAYSKFEYVKSIYMWNGDLLPGISDIDFILVLDDKITGKIPKHGFTIGRFNNSLRYFYYHNPLVVNEDLLGNFDCLFINKIKNCYGKVIKFRELESHRKKLYKIEVLTEIITRQLPRCILISLLSKKIDIRYTMLVLNVLKYSIETLESIVNDGMDKFNAYIDEYNYLRANWFSLDNDRHKLLFDTAVNAVGVSLDLIEFFTNYLIENGLIYKRNNAKEVSLKFLGKGQFTIFSHNWKKDDSLNKTLSIYKKIRRVIPILPMALSYQLTDYSGWHNLLGHHIRSNVVPTERIWYFSEQEIAKRRAHLLDSYLNFYESNNIPIAYYNAFGYYTKRQKRIKLEHRLEKMVVGLVT